MKKIGIITMLYDSVNYGGVLQAYALAKIIKKYGFKCEQILYDWKNGDISEIGILQKLKKLSLKKLVGKICNKILRHTHSVQNKKYINKLKDVNLKRKQSFDTFCKKNIDVSEVVYDKNNISRANDMYDIFVCGSDQIWNTHSIDRGYSLSFVSKEKKKIAYSVSGVPSAMSDTEKEYYKSEIKDFCAISTREQYACDVLNSVCGFNAVRTLDPTLLLSREEWDEICSDAIVKEKYVFCYFLGNTKKHKLDALDFAKKHNLKTVLITGAKFYREEFDKFDYYLDTSSPADFISLIKNSEYVFTDSFHASVFSLIYEKKFFVFERKDCGGFSRIQELIEMHGLTVADATINNNFSYKNSLTLNRVSDLREKSMEYLLNAVNY